MMDFSDLLFFIGGLFCGVGITGITIFIHDWLTRKRVRNNLLCEYSNAVATCGLTGPSVRIRQENVDNDEFLKYADAIDRLYLRVRRTSDVRD